MKILAKDPHFFLKLVSLILLVLAILLAAQPAKVWYHDIIAEGLTNSSTLVLLALIITIIFSESKKVAEICLIFAVLGMLIIACSMWVPRQSLQFTTSAVENEQPYVVFVTEQERRNAYFGLTIPAIILEVIDLILYAINK